MTLIYQDHADLPGVHAFVIGVGSYPFAKPGQGYEPLLSNVQDIASADSSAKFFVDWLYENRTSLTAPLRSVEMLVCDAVPDPGQQRYDLRVPLPAGTTINPPTKQHVESAGKAWAQRLKNAPDSIALFFACGHGAVKGTEHVIFLNDLNGDETDPWGGYLNVFSLASAFKQLPHVNAGFFFVDACQEVVAQFTLADTRGGAKFVPPFDTFKLSEEKVSLQSGASQGRLGYQGELAGSPGVWVGRYTQTLVEALKTSVRFRDDAWTINPQSISEDIKHLHRINHPEWHIEGFEPSQGLMPMEDRPLIKIANPQVPVVIMLDPSNQMALCRLSIFKDPNSAPLCQRLPAPGVDWKPVIPASNIQHLLEVVIPANPAKHVALTPIAPIFKKLVTVP